MARKKLGEMLIEAGVLTEDALHAALAEQRRWGGSLGRILLETTSLTETDLLRVLSTQLKLPTIDLDRIEIHPTVLEFVTGEFAEQHSLVPFAQPMKFLDVAMAEPTNLGVADELRIRTQLNIRPYLAGPKMIERALAKHYGRGFGRVRNLRRDGSLHIDLTAKPTASPGGPAHRPGRPSRPPPLEMPAGPVGPVPGPIGPPAISSRDAEIDVLQERISKLEALVARDEEVLRKLLALLIEKGVATREEILERIR